MFIAINWGMLFIDNSRKKNCRRFSNGKKITSYSFKIFIFLSLTIFYPSFILLGSASVVM